MKLKKYLECYISTETCNLRCHYCYITQQRKFNNKIVKFPHSIEKIKKAFSNKRLGGSCLINLCAGGETLLSEDVILLVKALLEENHFVMLVTNGTLSKRFDEIIKFPKEILERLIFKFSFHYLELKRLNKINEFFNNIDKIRKAGCSFTLEITPNDELIPYIEEIKDICLKKVGAYCHSTIARDDRTENIDILSKYNFEEYKEIWGKLNSDLFKFKKEIFYQKREEFCYAGAWSYYINIMTGDVRQCYCERIIDNIYKNIEQPLKEVPIGNNCSLPHCYNGHAFLSLGTIPELKTPTYASLRNRKSLSGEEWLSTIMKNFIEQKLSENNILYSDEKKKEINKKNKLFNKKKQILKKIKRGLRCIITLK